MSLDLEIDGATQYATLYFDGRPMATFQRRRVMDSHLKPRPPLWRAFDTNGVLVAVFFLNHRADYMARHVAAKLGLIATARKPKGVAA